MLKNFIFTILLNFCLLPTSIWAQAADNCAEIIIKIIEHLLSSANMTITTEIAALVLISHLVWQVLSKHRVSV